MPTAHAFTLGLAALLSLLPGWQQVAAPDAPFAKAPASAGHRIERASDGFFYIVARINGTPVRFLVDTGAGATVLSGSDARRAGIMSGTSMRRVRTVGGEARMADATIGAMAIAGRQLGQIDAVVAPRLSQSLIGQRVLSQFEHISIEGDTMRFD